MKNNIAYFVVNLNSYSGSAKQALLLAKNLSKEKEIFIFNFDTYIKDKNLIQLEENIYKIDLPKSFLRRIYQIYQIVKEKKIEIFHLHVLNYYTIFIGCLLRKKIVLKTTLLGADDFKSKIESKLGGIKFSIIKLIDYNVVLTKKTYEINSKLLDIDRVRIIPNGMKIPPYPYIKEKKNIFVCIGLVCQRKNTYKSIEYFIDHYSSTKDAKLFIIGPNSLEDNIPEFEIQYYLNCLELINTNDMNEKVIFTGLLNREKTFNYLISAKAILFFSLKEGMPNAVIEALSYNCIPITTELDGTALEMFEHKKSGYIISGYDDFIDIKQLDKIIKTKKAYLKAYENFSIKNIASIYDKFYLSILN